MNRKLLNDVRKVMVRRNFLLQRNKLDSRILKSFRPTVKNIEKKSQLDHKPVDKECIDRLKSLSK